MEIYQIRAFVTVARAGNLTRAADALHLTQPAVTAQIKALEQSLGVTLFDRASGRMTLARAGETLLPTAEALLLQVNQLKANAARLKGQLHGIVNLGVPSERMDFLRLALLASRITASLPMVELQTHILASADLIDQVSVGKLSAALTITAWPPRDVLWVPLRTVSYRLVAPNNLAAQARDAGWPEIAVMPWVDGPPGSHTHLLLREIFERHGLAPRSVMNSDDLANIDALVRAGAGCALMREEVALMGAQHRDFVVWSHAKVDAVLGFAVSQEQAADPVMMALVSMLREVWDLQELEELAVSDVDRPDSRLVGPRRR